MLVQIKASAGSGKTYTLTRQYLELLGRAGGLDAVASCGGAQGLSYGWPEVVAVTFTNKAATEMKERVVDSLKSIALGRTSDLPAPDWTQAKALGLLDQILRHFQHLGIRTIDSLVNQLLRLFSLELNLSADFAPLFDLGELFDPVYEQFLTRVRDHDPDDTALFQDALTAYLAHEHSLPFDVRPRMRQRLFEVWRRLMQSETLPHNDPQRLAEVVELIHADYQRRAQELKDSIKTHGIQANKNFLNFLDHCLASHPTDTPKDSRMIRKESFAECVNKPSRGQVTPELEDAYGRLRRLHRLLETQGRTLNRAASYAPFVSLASHLMRESLEHARGMALFPSVLWYRTITGLLAHPERLPEVFCRLGNRLHHLLLDEFQDTSREQWEAVEPLALECLSKGGGVLYVGDAKQAIYAWRGGDPELFEEVPLRPEMALLAPEVVRESLPSNWRSLEPVVAFNNRLFEQLAAPETAARVAATLMDGGQAHDEQISLLASALTRTFAGCRQEVIPEHRGRIGHVRVEELTPVSDTDSGQGEDSPNPPSERYRSLALARLSALFREELIPRGRHLDAAVLVRSNTQASHAARTLMDLGLPVITENSLLLAEHPLIGQMVSFLEFLDYPLNNAALYHFITGEELFGRATGLGREDMTDWALANSGRPLYTAFRADFPDVWEQFIDPFHTQAGLKTPYDLAFQAFRVFGVYGACGDEGGHARSRAFVQRFLEVLHRAEESGHASLSGFLDHWRRRSTEIKVPMPENAPAVQVTTIHKAKGLQFPVVVVPFTDFRISATNDLEVVRAAGEDVLLPLAPYVGEEYHRRLGRNALEALNLLYVACTRPREELYAFIPGAGTSPGPFARAVRLLLEEAGLDPGQEAVRCGCLPATTSADQTRPGPAPRDAKPTPVTTTHGQGSHWLGRLRVYRNLTQDTDLGLDEAMRGTLMHAALEAFHPCGDIETAARLAVSEALARHPFLDPEHSELARDMTSMLRWLAHEPELASLLARGQREVDVVDADGARHRMDLLVEDRTGMLVVDYKTGGYVPGAHEEQVKGYMRLAGAATGKPARGLLVYLDARRLHWVKD